MAQYRVNSTILEPPRGSIFTTVPKWNLDEGDLALFCFGDTLIVGRWIPDWDGYNWIKLPGLLIRITGQIIVSIIGLVVPMTAPPCLN